MNHLNKTKDELINELQEVSKELDLLKKTHSATIDAKEHEKSLLKTLIKSSQDFIIYADQTPDYNKILQTIIDISGAKYAVLNLSDEDEMGFSTIAISGIQENISKAIANLGFNIINHHWHHDPVRAEKTKNKIVTRFKNLRDLTGYTFAQSAILLIERTFRIGEVYLVKIKKEDKLIGDFTLIFSVDNTLVNENLAELYADLIGQHIDKNRKFQNLRINEELYSSLIANISDVVATISTEGRFKYISPNIEQWFGWQPNELIGQEIWAKVHSDDLSRVKIGINLLLEHENASKTTEYRILCKDGRYTWISLTAINLIHNPQIHGVLLNFHDVNSQKEIEETLLSERTLFRTILDLIPDAIYVKDRDGRKTMANPTELQLSGKSSEEEILGLTDYDLYSNDEALKGMTEDRYVVVTDEPILNKEGTLIDKEGRSHSLLISKVPLHNLKSEIIGLVGITHDITELKQAEEEILKLSKAVEQNPASIVITDINGNIEYVNPKFCSLTGYSKEEVIGKNPRILKSTHTALETYKELWHKILEGEVWQGEFQNIKKNGDTYWESVTISPILNNNGEIAHFISLKENITEQKISEENLINYTEEIELKNLELDMALFSADQATAHANEMMAQAEMATKAKGLFLANMSHEIRTPLNAIIGFSQIMKRDPQLTEKQREYVVSTIRSGEHLLTLINDILELSKMEAGAELLNPANINLYDFFEDIRIMFHERAKAKHIGFKFTVEDNYPQQAFFDEGKLRQVFVNLVGNAIKFTDRGGVSIRISVKKNNDGTENYTLKAEIEDTGFGISETELGLLFKHFVQTNSGIKKGSGTGLGLALSREIAKLMGGDISVTSKVGIGSTFAFTVQMKRGTNEVTIKNSAVTKDNKVLSNDAINKSNIEKLPNAIKKQMLDAIDVADLDMLIELIKRIELHNKNLAQQLLTLANNYDYNYLRELLS